MPTLATQGCQLYYEVHGDGPETIVFAHGAGGNHISWWQQIPYYRERYRCVTFDHRGWGASKDESGEGRTAFRRDLEELFDHLGIEHAVLIAQSMGGFTCLPFAATHPDKVRALIMADTFLGIGDEGLMADMRANLEKVQATAAAGGQTSMVGPSFIENNPNGLFLYQQVRGLNPEVAVTLSFGVEDGAVSKDQLKALTMPVLFLAGEHDAVLPAVLIERASHMVPSAKYVEVPDGGHSVYWELPAEFNRIVDGVLAEAYP